jgi:hypothetical protein
LRKPQQRGAGSPERQGVPAHRRLAIPALVRSWKRDREEEVVLAAVQEEVLIEQEEASECTEEAKERGMGRRSRMWRGSGGETVVL